MRNSLCTQTGAFEREAKAHQEEDADDDCEQTSDVDLMLRPSPPKEEEKYGAEQVEEDLALMEKVKGSSVPRLVSGLILLPGPLLAPAHHDHDNFQLHRSFYQQSLPL